MSSVTKIAIAGFTGKLARLITASLIQQHPNVHIYGICRSPDKVDKSILSNPRVKVFEASSTDTAALRQALAGTNVCVCCYLGNENLMIDGQKTLIDACIAEGVDRYIASDWTLDFSKLQFGDHPAKDAMKHVQAYLERKEQVSSLKAVHILNGAFMEVVWAPFIGLVDAENSIFRYFGTGDEPLEMTTMQDAASFTAEVAVDPTAVGFLKFLGDRKSIKGLATAYQKAFGVSPQLQRLGSLQELHGKMNQIFKEQPGNPFAWMGNFYQYYMADGSTYLVNLDNNRYPSVKPTSIEKFLENYTKDSVGKSALF